MEPQKTRHHLLEFLLILVFPLIASIYADLAADREALLRLSEAVHGRTVQWNTTSPTPCSWEGVTCDTTMNRVTALRLPGDRLSGQLPENTVGSLTELRKLSLHHNFLSGPLPSDLGSCTELRSLSLQDNRLSGEIPDGLFKLSNLLRVNLARNNFSGRISSEFDNLTKLRTLYLESNKFQGSLPELNSLSDLREFNVSLNNVSGSIPRRLNGFHSQSFLGNSLCGGPLASCPKGGSKLSKGAIAGIVLGSVFGLLLILLVLLLSWRKYRSAKLFRPVEMSRTPESPVKLTEYDLQTPRPFIARVVARENGGREIRNGSNDQLIFLGDTIQIFSLEELLRASAEVLGKGIIGTTYKAYLETGNEVVVKRLRNVCVSEMEFKAKVEELGSLVHENLVPLRAYFYGRDEKLVVFESMPMGSLYSILHGNRGTDRASLNWVTRSRIALGAARGIEYLHSLGSNISHGNIKSSNILLTQYYDACVSEYCITKLVSSITLSNLIGYRAPELTDLHKVSQKADVYSFGVLLLELLTGKAPKSALDEGGIDLRKRVKSVVQEKWTIEVFDPDLSRYQDFEEQMVQLLHLAISCTSDHPDKRPLMKEVVQRIKGICGVRFSD